MATLMLSSLGSAVAGPLGAAVGGLLGQAIDRSIFGSAIRSGPRLDDLRVQTSSYGNMVPRIYGKMRVAGTVIWATDLKEGNDLESGGKGQPDTLSYSYSASFAVALSSRPIQEIRRIWADGQLLRGSAGDFKVKTKFRVYDGHEDQFYDPLIASIEGLDNTPAFRGMAVAVFENLQLATFGNRIPMLTFEVVADPEPTELRMVLSDLSSGIVDATETTSIIGYAGYGETVRDACEPLIDIFNVRLREEGLIFGGAVDAESETVMAHELGCAFDDKPVSPMEHVHRATSELPEALSLSFYDESRDYQTGEQHAAQSEHAGRRRRLELPAVLPASAAKSLAATNLARLWTERNVVRLRLPPAWLTLARGDLLRVPGNGEVWRVTKVEIDGLVVTADLVRSRVAAGESDADPGRSISAPDHIAQPLHPVLLEIPGQEVTTGLQMHLAASGGQTPWQPVPVLISAPGSEFVAMTARKRTVIGEVLKLPGSASSALLDLVNSVEIHLSHEDDWLRSCDDDSLAAGTNLAALGDEIIQFGNATPLGGRRFRISRLLRGRGGTEWAVAGHAQGETFVLLDQAALTRIDLPRGALNTAVLATGLGVGDGDAPGQAERTLTAEVLRPPSPVHLRALRHADGSLSVRWTRRSRMGWTWDDGVETPLGETREQYRIRLTGSAQVIERFTAEPTCLFTASEFGSVGAGDVLIAVAQVGDFAASHETTLNLVPNSGEFE